MPTFDGVRLVSVRDGRRGGGVAVREKFRSDTEAGLHNLTTAFQHYRTALAKLVARIVKPHDIEDIVQETYIRIYQAAQKEPIFHAKSFMLKTARNLALNHMARADALNHLAAIQMDAENDPEAQPFRQRQSDFPIGDNLNSPHRSTEALKGRVKWFHAHSEGVDEGQREILCGLRRKPTKLRCLNGSRPRSIFLESGVASDRPSDRLPSRHQDTADRP